VLPLLGYLFAMLSFFPSSSKAQETAVTPGPTHTISGDESAKPIELSELQTATISNLARNILADPMLRDCPPGSCILFVESFVLRSNVTCAACTEIARTFILKLSDNSNAIHVINGEDLRAIASERKIPLETELSTAGGFVAWPKTSRHQRDLWDR
jgi:hypothetical protein